MLQGHLNAAFPYLKGAYEKDGMRLSMRACCDRTRGNGFKLKEVRFSIDKREKVFVMRMVRHCKKLPREAVYQWKCSRSGWMGLWATLSSERCSCPGGWN